MSKGDSLRRKERKEIWGFPGGPVVKISLAMQGAPVRSLAWEDSTCQGATKSEPPNY